MIAAVTNALEHREFPFVFGGDGASFAVPPAYLDAAREANHAEALGFFSAFTASAPALSFAAFRAAASALRASTISAGVRA